uniref:Ferritin n=1 Tax=Piliocolobus tephrosceles TaxID=591936 RepID=A0A8C9HLR4_9PRIM
MSSHISQNYCAEVEAADSSLDNPQLRESLTYLSLFLHFHRDDVALEGMGHFFRELAQKKRQDAQSLWKTQNHRRALCDATQKLSWDEQDSSLGVLQAAVALEMSLNQALLDLHTLGAKHADPHLCGFLENDFLGSKRKLIWKMGNHLTRLSGLEWPNPRWPGLFLRRNKEPAAPRGLQEARRPHSSV